MLVATQVRFKLELELVLNLFERDRDGSEMQVHGDDLWRECAMRIWCVGGWRLQVRGGEVRGLNGSGAEEALARHLAVRHPNGCDGDELRRLISRKRGSSVPKSSLQTAANKLRALIASAAAHVEDPEGLAKSLFPRAAWQVAPDGSRAYSYGFATNVWVDLADAPNPRAFWSLETDREDTIELGGGQRSQAFSGAEVLARQARASLNRDHPLKDDELPTHLQGFTPPIGRLADLVPTALDRLSPDSLLVIQGKGESGRLHLTEAIELATLAWCSGGAEQMREQSEEVPGPIAKVERAAPGHLYILDLTRPLTPPQEERLREIRAHANRTEGQRRPALLIVSDGSPLPDRGEFTGWKQAETISLQNPTQKEVAEAYLIATRCLDRDRESGEAEFERLADEYAREHGAEIGLRAASAAASIAVGEVRAPKAAELPPPGSEDPPIDGLGAEERELAQALAWFGNTPFTLADARAATECEDLPWSEIFRIATKIPGGGAGTYEVHPRLLEVEAAPEVPARICRYLLGRDNESAIERWPLRAMRILDAKSVDVVDRMRLAPKLIGLSRDLGFADDLQGRMKKLLRARGVDRLAATELKIGRARLLTHLGRLGDAEAVLRPIVAEKASEKVEKHLRAEAYLRLAITASQRGNRDVARERAKEAKRLAPGDLRGRVERYYGWEALYSGRFEAAIGKFDKALEIEQQDEDRADATIGATLALLRLGRLKKAEARLKDLDPAGLRRITRNRVIRAEATARFLWGKPEEGVEILDRALGRDESRPTFQSADLLEARAYLNVKLGPESLATAKKDRDRCAVLLQTEDEWQEAVLHYLNSLIAEASMHAEPQGSEVLREQARESAARSVEAAKSNPWHQARAHTLLGRLDAEGDGQTLAEDLRAAAVAHRGLSPPCPDVLRETTELAARAADAWSLPEKARSLREMGAELAPREEPAAFDRDAALSLIESVAAEVGSASRPEAPPASAASVGALGAVGGLLLHTASDVLAYGGEPGLRLLQPRPSRAMAAGVYDLDPSSGELTPTPGMPPGGLSILKGSTARRFAEQRLGAVLIASSVAEGAAGPIRLGRWLEGFSAAARKRGIALVEPIAIEPRALKELGLWEAGSFVAVGLAELPQLV